GTYVGLILLTVTAARACLQFTYQTVNVLCQCKMAPKERRNCGYPGISEVECRKAGCCFNDSVPGMPWCFAPKPKKVRKVCPNDPHARINCGFPGITAQECEKKGCCFNTQPAGVPWCFYHRVVEEGKLLHKTSSPIPWKLLAGSVLCLSLACCASLAWLEATLKGASRTGSPPFLEWVQSFHTQGTSGEEVAKP
uniref:Trefoil factor 2 n=1 Tax=Bubo bubo TaxID=30461 RepID=A0A8C0ESF4_BUBBB